MTGARDDHHGDPSSSGGTGLPERIRASSTSTRHQIRYDRPQEAVVTAETPVVRPSRPLTAAPRYANAPASRQQPPRNRPDAAPAPLRLLVWTLLFALVLVFVLFLTVLVHPTWLSLLRNVVSTPQSLGVTLSRHLY